VDTAGTAAGRSLGRSENDIGRERKRGHGGATFAPAAARWTGRGEEGGKRRSEVEGGGGGWLDAGLVATERTASGCRRGGCRGRQLWPCGCGGERYAPVRACLTNNR
jgi:hypothetical protein